MVDREGLGPAERIIQTLLTHTDHLYHGRPGVVRTDGRSQTGAKWDFVTHKVENGEKVVYQLSKAGRKTVRTKLGVLRDDGKVVNGRVVGEYRKPGLFTEAAVWVYKQIAEVWKLDNEFAARWASYAYGQEHRDLKLALAAFMLVQSRKGDPVLSNGEVLTGAGYQKLGLQIEFHDEDFRDVGEAMILLYEKGKGIDPKMLLRIYDLLTLPEVAKLNHELGFGKSARKPFLGRWPKAVEKWLRYREENPKMLKGLVEGGWKTSVRKLAQLIRYKPTSPAFYEALRWKQVQAEDGRREIAIGAEVKAAESWEGLTEMEICQKIEKERPNYKRIVSLLPRDVGVTRAVMAAAIEAKCLSDKDLIILTPTIEELGLLKVQDIRDRWEAATKRAEDMRAANIAKNVKTKEAKEKLEEAADTAVQKAVEEVVRGTRIYVMVDISSSMTGAIDIAKKHLAKFVQGIPLDQLHVSTFNSAGREIVIKHRSTAGVTNAFRGVNAGGSTNYGEGVMALRHHQPKAEEDVVFLFIGDSNAPDFVKAVEQSGLNPVAFGFAPHGNRAPRRYGGTWGECVERTAARLNIPCFEIDERTFEDPYAIPRTIQNLIAATPVGHKGAAVAKPRVTLVDTILKTELLKKPAWAA